MDASGLKAEASGHVNPLHIDLLTCVPVTYGQLASSQSTVPKPNFLANFWAYVTRQIRKR